ncbi:response regulator [Parasediminibacterium sp. JCM 36343]|uniref:response regulator n=1 Tax=Parasediminibacterium sp. JCM 36343 TaxID=3374279 RepID=UPI00397E3614
MVEQINKSLDILLVEDNEGDIVLTMEALAEVTLNNPVSVARDGEQALAFLKKEAPYEDTVMPNLILLDINLPRVDGIEVLLFIKKHPALKRIPVIMLTTSNSKNDINEAYSNHANFYITKPVDLDSFFALVQSIQLHWTSVIKLPAD